MKIIKKKKNRPSKWCDEWCKTKGHYDGCKGKLQTNKKRTKNDKTT